MKIEVKKALEAIYERDGAVSPQAVLDAAKPKNSPLHKLFDWDDAAAAEAHRLNQARQLIRVAVVMLPQIANSPVRQFVSLSSLRKTGGASYLATVDVMADEAQAAQALADAVTALQSLQKRFRYLPQLAPVWDALAQLTSDDLESQDVAA